MGSFLSELGTRLADRWLAQLVLPGLVLVGLSATAALLGQGRALDWRALDTYATHGLHTASGWTTAGQVLFLALVLLGCAAIGGTVRAASQLARIVWFGAWPRWSDPLARRLTMRRARRWDALQAQLAARRAQAPPQERSAQLLAELADLSQRRDRIALAAPTRPTFTGDSLAAIGTRVFNQYGADLNACWPRMWVLLPVDVRDELRAARASLDTAVAASVWAVCYAVLACFWWPAALIAAGTQLAAWVRGRAAVADLAEMVESTVDVYLRRLAVELGISVPEGPVDRQTGTTVTRIARKGA